MKTHRAISAILLPLLLAAGLAPAGEPPDTVRLAAKTASQSQVRIQKVDRFLNEFTRASSLEDLARRYHAGKFTPAEQEALKGRLQDPRFDQKLESLVQKEKQRFTVRMERPTATQRTAKSAARATAPHTAANVQARLQRLRVEADRTRRAMAAARPATTRTAPSGMMMAQRPGATPSTARITNVSPPVGRLGQQVTIAGVDFGTARGRVAVAVGAPNPALGNMAMAQVSSWSQNRIVATLPTELQRFVGESPKDGMVWVKLAGGETGPYTDYRLEPDLAAVQPVITEVVPDPILPGSTIVISGQNFLTEAAPTVTASAPGTDTAVLNIAEWGPNYVAIAPGGGHGHSIPYNAGASVQLTVRNHLGLEASRWVALERPLQRHTFTKFHNHRVQCEVWNSSRDRPSVFCLAGYRKTFSSDVGRCPGWNIVDYSVRIHDEGGSNGYTFRQEPFGQVMAYEIEVWADLYSWIELEVVLEMEGPQGTYCW